MRAFGSRWFAIVVFSLAGFCPAALAAEGYDQPGLLAIESSPKNPVATYTYDQLKAAFKQQVLETHTPWTQDGAKTRFRGPYLKDILAKSGFDKEKAIEAYALDGFSMPIPREDIEKYSPILAIEMACSDDDLKSGLCKEGQEYRPLRLEDRGPFYMTWPFDTLPKEYMPANTNLWVFFVVALRPVP